VVARGGPGGKIEKRTDGVGTETGFMELTETRG